MQAYALMFLAGGAGALARYGLALWMHQLLGQRFAWGTLAVNVIGCLAIGMLMPMIAGGLLFRDARLVLVVGFLGSFTTFSIFGWETLQFLHEGRQGAALLNIGANVVLGVAAVWVGAQLGRSLAV